MKKDFEQLLKNAPTGRFSYESREPQYTFLETWIDLLKNQKTGVIEAPTGTGKTFAYLYPLLRKISSDEIRGFVVTSTINLQEQIFHHDLPFLIDLMPNEYDIALLKGRQNYLCLKRLDQLSGELSAEDLIHITPLYQWADETEDGTYQEIDEQIPQHIWGKISSIQGVCDGRKCPFYKKCYFFKARFAAEKADLIIGNHHLLITDTYQKDYPFLEKIDAVVIDEAHRFSGNLESILTLKIQRSELFWHLSRIDKGLGDQNLQKFFVTNSDTLSLINNLIASLSLFKDDVDTLFTKLEKLAPKGCNLNEKTHPMSKHQALKKVFEDFCPEVKKLYTLWISVWQEIQTIVESLDESYQQAFTPHHFKLELYQIFFQRLYTLFNPDLISDFHRLSLVKWFDIDDDRISFSRLDLSEIPAFSKKFFKPGISYLFTSATLTTGGTFNYFCKQLGIKGSTNLILPSPFNLREQVDFYVADILYKYKDNSYFDTIAGFLNKHILGPKTLVLFASYHDLEMVYQRLESLTDTPLLRQQRHHSRHRLLELFKVTDSAMLLGTRSFWEGIDLKGDLLNEVVVVKLPFASIKDPVLHNKDLLWRGVNRSPFYEMMLPDMVLTLKQGLGRLIRASSDRGRFFLLDDRFLNATYASVLQNSFSEYTVQTLKKDDQPLTETSPELFL